MSGKSCATQCPNCGQANHCGMIDTQTAQQPCWCFALTIDSAHIADLPSVQRGVTCLCLRCAQAVPPIAASQPS
jgi:hypothetical protein